MLKKKLLPSEWNYSTIEGEALAIVKGVKHFRTYLEGKLFTIQTDTNPLTHLNNLKDSHSSLARWALTLQPYNFTVKHRADGLSRDPSAAEVGEMSEPQRLLPVTLPVTRQGTSKGHQEVNNKKENKEINKKDDNNKVN